MIGVATFCNGMITHQYCYMISKMNALVRPRGLVCRCAMLLLVASTFTLSDGADVTRQHAREVQTLMEWFEQHATVFNRKQQVRREMPNDPNSAIGVFAAEDISKGEVLFALPWNATINDQRPAGADDGSDTSDEGAIECNTVRNLIDEMRRGSESKFAPYVEYLMQQRSGQLPSAWSRQGKALMFDVLGGTNTLPPKHPYHWISDDWRKGCNGGSNPLEENAAMLVVQRAEDDLMIPLYDMYNHRNGNYHNTINHRIEGKKFYMKASRNIEQGEQIYNSYNLCSGCEGRKGAYGTAEIFRDYGFIEQYPQRWIFPELNFAFQVEEAGGSDINTSALRVRWGRKGPPSEEATEFMRKQILRLERLQKLAEDDSEIALIPTHEAASIFSYVEAIVQGMKLVLREVAPDMTLSCANDSCLPSDGYDELLDEIDELPYEGFVTCEPSDVVDVNSYVQIEKTQSAYQEIGFFGNEKRDDVCFELEGTTQICTNYRPHYHELMVHVPASYMKSVRRVVFVGGGDSMLLHEVLKYPSLELVVGLELDQVVVRKAFQHFHTLPHFNDERVEWWFGDAAKSLLVLPREYFGSFDMVLVDLSETVMSFAVTNKLDMLQSLALLLNGNGIMVKNELYLEKMNTIFDFTAQFYFANVPFLCDQIMVMGSNGRDFLREVPVNHDVEMKLLSPEDILNFSKYFHDYNDNTSILRETERKDQATDIDDKSDPQERRAGILLVAEVANMSLTVAPHGKLKERVATTLEALGLHTLGSDDPGSAPNDINEAVFTTIMEEGYITVRVWPDQKYCALDIHLWSSFNKMEQLRDALVKALGSDHSSLSSYRIVTGGMQGTSTWDEDHKTIGPVIEQTRSCDGADYIREGDLNSKETRDIITEEALGLLQGDGALAAVMCGPTKEDCKSLDAVTRHKSIDEVIFIPTCPELVATSEFSENIGDIMVQCEKEILTALRATASSKGRISAFVVDPSAPVTMVKIASSIWSSQRNLENLLAKNFTFIVAIHGSDESQHQRHNFLDRIRKVVKFDPLHAAEITVSGMDELAGIGILAREDEMFFSHLRTAVANIENRTGLTMTTRRITGGLWRYLDKDAYRPKVFSSNDYDPQPAKDQFRSQIFYGRQVVAQYSFEEGVKSAVLITALDQTVGSITKRANTHTLSFAIGDGLVASSVFEKGSIVLVWDGAKRTDINLFLYRKYEFQMNRIMTTLAEKLPRATLSLRDEQPRGVSVVTLMEDVI